MTVADIRFERFLQSEDSWRAAAAGRASAAPNRRDARRGSTYLSVNTKKEKLSSAFKVIYSFSSVVSQVMGRVAPSVDLAMDKLRAVVDEQRERGLGRRLVLYIVPPSCGAITFGATLMAAQAAGAAAGVSCASPVLASLMGCTALGCASAASAQVSYSLRKFCSQKPLKQGAPFLSKDNLLLKAVFGVILYKVLGGRCRNLMPSNIVSPGALARASIPARGRKYANEVEQGLIQVLYRKHGCHHCGKRAGESIADHMPPNVIAYGRGWAKIAPPPTKFSSVLAKLASTIPLPALPPPKVIQQRFYPQCMDCTKIQSAALRHGKKALVLHFRRGIPEAPYFTGFCIGAMGLEGLQTPADKRTR